MLEKVYRANIVCDELNDIYWDPIDPENPYHGMARRAIAQPLNGSIQRRIEHLQKLARNYKLDGAINPCHWGCRQGTGARGMISDGLKEIGVPVLNLEVDCVDTRNYAEGQLRTRIEAFSKPLSRCSRIGRVHGNNQFPIPDILSLCPDTTRIDNSTGFR